MGCWLSVVDLLDGLFGLGLSGFSRPLGIVACDHEGFLFVY